MKILCYDSFLENGRTQKKIFNQKALKLLRRHLKCLFDQVWPRWKKKNLFVVFIKVSCPPWETALIVQNCYDLITGWRSHANSDKFSDAAKNTAITNYNLLCIVCCSIDRLKYLFRTFLFLTGIRVGIWPTD